MVTCCWSESEFLAVSIINGGCSRTDSSMITLRNSDCISVNRESCTDRTARWNFTELVFLTQRIVDSYWFSIDRYTRDMIPRIWRYCESLCITIINCSCTRRNLAVIALSNSDRVSWRWSCAYHWDRAAVPTSVCSIDVFTVGCYCYASSSSKGITHFAKGYIFYYCICSCTNHWKPITTTAHPIIICSVKVFAVGCNCNAAPAFFWTKPAAAKGYVCCYYVCGCANH